MSQIDHIDMLRCAKIEGWEKPVRSNLRGENAVTARPWHVACVSSLLFVGSMYIYVENLSYLIRRGPHVEFSEPA
ncbi:hypothetical protein SBBP2_310028 [Burkholderiales bacterium]|nr:hypothetical protein SBBP2_310028 [Burkholderiales bacterium]